MPSQVPRMNEQESDAWVGLATLVQLLPAALDAQLQQDSQMTHFEYGVLSRLRLAPDETLQLKQLAEQVSATLPRLSHVISNLERRLLVERVPHPDDKRATNVRLTGAGRRSVALATSGHVSLVRRLVLDHLDAGELDTLARMTKKLNDGLDPNDRLSRGG